MKMVNLAEPVAVRHPESEQFVTLANGQEFADDDVIVAAFPWAFEKRDPDAAPAAPADSVVIEMATARPGEKRRRAQR